MQNSTLFTVILAVFFLFPEKSDAQVYLNTEGYVEFISTAPLLEFKGTSENLAGMLNTETGEVDFYVDLASLDTGNRRRDRDMRQVYLETDKFPFAEFSGKLNAPFDPEADGEQSVTVTGNFEMRDISREMTIAGTVEVLEEGLRVKANWQVKLEDFNIDRPRVVFYELSDVQTINIDITLYPHEED